MSGDRRWLWQGSQGSFVRIRVVPGACDDERADGLFSCRSMVPIGAHANRSWVRRTRSDEWRTGVRYSSGGESAVDRLRALWREVVRQLFYWVKGSMDWRAAT